MQIRNPGIRMQLFDESDGMSQTPNTATSTPATIASAFPGIDSTAESLPLDTSTPPGMSSQATSNVSSYSPEWIAGSKTDEGLPEEKMLALTKQAETLSAVGVH